MKLTLRVLLLLACLWAAPTRSTFPSQQRSAQSSNAADTSNPSKCEGAGRSEVTLVCNYSAEGMDGSKKEPRIALVHAVIRFDAKNEGKMHIELTFRNEGETLFTEARTVYIQFDDETGQNYIRRALPSVEFQKIAPGETRTFTETFLAAAFRPRRYLIRLWIPNPDPTLKFDASHNFLLSNAALAEAETRLNQIAAVTVEP